MRSQGGSPIRRGTVVAAYLFGALVLGRLTYQYVPGGAPPKPSPRIRTRGGVVVKATVAAPPSQEPSSMGAVLGSLAAVFVAIAAATGLRAPLLEDPTLSANPGAMLLPRQNVEAVVTMASALADSGAEIWAGYRRELELAMEGRGEIAAASRELAAASQSAVDGVRRQATVALPRAEGAIAQGAVATAGFSAAAAAAARPQIVWAWAWLHSSMASPGPGGSATLPSPLPSPRITPRVVSLPSPRQSPRYVYVPHRQPNLPSGETAELKSLLLGYR